MRIKKQFNIRIYKWLVAFGIETDQAYNLVRYYQKRALELLNTIKNEIH